MTLHDSRRTGAPPPPESLDPAERMGVDELRALQLERLRRTLRHAYEHVPHYRRSFDAAGVHPDDCRELADLARFPTTSKADLRENYPSACSPSRGRRSAGCMRPRGRRAGRPSSATRRATSTSGPTRWRAPSVPPAAARATWCTWPTATACSPAASAPTTAPSAWVAPSSPCPAA